LDFWYGCENNTSQSTLINNKDTKTHSTDVSRFLGKEERKYFCNNPKCKKEIAKDVVAYCLHKDNKDCFNGKVYCRECQGDV
ncbi:unnamed protein product, partial [marine sediment metagenome]